MIGRVSVGFDPGLANCGFGVVERQGSRLTWLEYGTITTDAARPLEEREALIWSEASRLVAEHHPTVIGLEDQSGVATAARMNVKRQLEAARRGGEVQGFGFNASNDGVVEVVGVLKAVAFAYRVPILMMQPRSVKVQLLGTGSGKAEKQEIKAAIARLFPDAGRMSSHAADGLAIAIGAERISFLETLRAG